MSRRQELNDFRAKVRAIQTGIAQSLDNADMHIADESKRADLIKESAEINSSIVRYHAEAAKAYNASLQKSKASVKNAGYTKIAQEYEVQNIDRAIRGANKYIKQQSFLQLFPDEYMIAKRYPDAELGRKMALWHLDEERRDLGFQKQKASDASQTVIAMKRDKKAMMKEMDELKSQLAGETTTNDAKDKSLQKFIDSLRAEIKVKTQKMLADQKIISSLQAELKVKDEKMLIEKKTKQSLLSKNTVQKLVNDRLNSDAELHKKMIKSLREDIGVQKTINDGLKSNFAAQKSINDGIQSDLDAQKALNDCLKSDLDVQKTAKENLVVEVEAQQKANISLKFLIEDLDIELEKVATKMANMKAENKSLRTQLVQKTKKCDAEKMALTVACNEVKHQLSTKNKECDAEKMKMTAALDDLKIQLSLQTQTYNAEKTAITLQRDDVKSQLAESIKKGYILVTNHKEGQNKLAETVEKYDVLHAQNEEVKSELEETMKKCDVLLAQNEKIKNESAENTKIFGIEQTELLTERDGLMSQIQTLTTQLETNSHQTDQITSRIEHHSAVIQAVREQLEIKTKESLKLQYLLDTSLEASHRDMASLMEVVKDLSKRQAECQQKGGDDKMKTQVATAGTQTELSSLNSRTIPMSAYDAVVKKWDEEKMKVKDITTLYEQSKAETAEANQAESWARGAFNNSVQLIQALQAKVEAAGSECTNSPECTSCRYHLGRLLSISRSAEAVSLEMVDEEQHRRFLLEEELQQLRLAEERKTAVSSPPTSPETREEDDSCSVSGSETTENSVEFILE